MAAHHVIPDAEMLLLYWMDIVDNKCHVYSMVLGAFHHFYARALGIIRYTDESRQWPCAG